MNEADKIERYQLERRRVGRLRHQIRGLMRAVDKLRHEVAELRQPISFSGRPPHWLAVPTSELSQELLDQLDKLVAEERDDSNEKHGRPLIGKNGEGGNAECAYHPV